MPCSPRQRYLRGFTLTEIAIVMGVVGILLAAIILAGGAVNNRLRVNRAVSDIIRITNNLRSYYQSGTLPSAAQGTLPFGGDLTSQLINAQVIPTDIVQPITCSAGPANSPCPLGPWENPISVGTQTNWGGLTGVTPSAGAQFTPRLFEIALWNLKNSQCYPFLVQMVSNAATNRLRWIYVNGLGAAVIDGTITPTSPILINCNDTVILQFYL